MVGRGAAEEGFALHLRFSYAIRLFRTGCPQLAPDSTVQRFGIARRATHPGNARYACLQIEHPCPL